MKIWPIISVFLLLECAPDAPHKPVLPGSINGEVLTLFGSKPLDRASAQLFPDQRVDSTDEQGHFSFTLLSSGSYLVTVSKDLYTAKNETIYIDQGEDTTIRFALNGTPLIQDCSIHSIHSMSSFEQYEIAFALSLFDLDAFIADSVVAESEKEKFILTYQYGDTLGFYRKALSFNGLSTIDTIIGIAFHFWVKDMGGTFSDTAFSELVRVIDKIPQIIYPISGDSLKIGDTLKWTSPYLPYATFVMLKIWELGSSIENPVWMSDTLQITDSTYLFSEQIKDGTYEWAVEIIDRLGNSSRAISWFYF